MSENKPECLQYYVDYEPIDLIWKSYDHTDITIDMFSKCPYCVTSLAFRSEPEWVFFCQNENCNWWLNTPAPKPVGFKSLTETGKWACIKKFDIDDKYIPREILRDYLNKHPNSVVHTNSTAFEKLVCDILNEKYGDAEFIHVGKPNDGGKDIIGVLKNDDFIFIEIKRRQKLLTAESVSTVRSLLGAMSREGVKNGLVVSTAKKFSKSAHQFSIPKQESINQYNIDLVSFNNIVEWLKISPEEKKFIWQDVIQKRELPDEYTPFIRWH